MGRSQFLMGKLWKNYGTSPLMGKSTISTGPFSSSQTVSLPEGNHGSIQVQNIG